MKILPFTTSTDEECDVDHIFQVKNNSEEKPKIYEVIIKLSPYEDDCWKFLSATCQCKGFQCKKTDKCKHIRLCMDTLYEFQKFDYELPRKEEAREQS
jgi:hypothetical protein